MRSVITQISNMNLRHPLPKSLPFRIRNGAPSVALAPMEGVTDAPMRALMSELGGFDYVVSEFLRVSQDVPPARVFLDHVPELKDSEPAQPFCVTPSGVPIQIQLLGGDAGKLAETAASACRLGSPGVDLNFGCPAPTVNRHDGGATLLKHPQRIRSIVEAVRRAVPPELPVSAKLRLGWDSLDPIHENAEMAAQGGASWITIHGRTRMQGYAPPAYWAPIGEVKKRLTIPVVANGEIWNLDDFKRCREETACEHYMLGRGALADPYLSIAIRKELGLEPLRSVPHLTGFPETSAKPAELSLSLSPDAWVPLLKRFAELSLPHTDHTGYIVPRIKQWARYVHLGRGAPWYESLKRLQTLEEVYFTLSNSTSNSTTTSGAS